MPTDPSDPSSPKPSTRLYQTTDEPKGGGGGGIFFVILLLLLLGGGAAYYFLVYKPAAAAGVTAVAAPPTAAAPAKSSATPKVDPLANPTYNAAQRAQYVRQAEDGFRAVADPKRVAFIDSYQAILTAGGVSAVGLTSKEAIAARRDLIAKCQTANDDYEAFVKTQEQIYKSELQKTPLVPNDVDRTFEDFAFKAQTEGNIRLRELQRESLKTSDEMLAYLDKTYGNWSINAAQHLTFKSGAAGPFNTLAKTYNDQAAAISKLQSEIKALVDPNATPPASPAASPAASVAPVSPTIAPAPNATP